MENQAVKCIYLLSIVVQHKQIETSGAPAARKSHN